MILEAIYGISIFMIFLGVVIAFRKARRLL